MGLGMALGTPLGKRLAIRLLKEPGAVLVVVSAMVWEVELELVGSPEVP